MFINVTRYGSVRTLRLAVAAIGYLDEAPGGAAVHLLGGESLRTTETPAEIEQLLDAAWPTATLIEGASAIMTPREMIAGDIMPEPELESVAPQPRKQRR